MLQKFILALVFPLILSAANSLHDRDESDVNLISGTKATDMPYGYYIKQFSKSSIKAFENVDLTLYPDKKLLVGYGTYDVNNENCRYLDIPSNASMPIDFENITVLGNETYAVSRTRMTYPQCKALVAKYSGYVYTPMDISNYSAVLNKLNNLSNGGTAKDLWVGYGRVDCSSPYLNDEGVNQSFTSFRNKNEICSDFNLYTYSIPNTRIWQRTGLSDQHYCPIVIKSPDYLRPIKYCAPWWRVERSWKLQKNEDLYEINGHTYDYRYMKYIMDYPKDVTICTETNTSISADSQRFEFTCNSYDDIKASPACIQQITLPQCHVNMCKGYAENTCIKVDSFPPFKDYDVGYIMVDGVEQKVKTKENKIINVYDCPPPNPPAANCVKKEVVSVIPVECPNSKCDELAACLKSDVKSADDCFATYTCEKSYGSTSSVKYENGVAVGLWGVCGDGNTSTQVLALIERKSSTKRICTEFNTYDETNITIKKCTSEAASSNKIVSTSITQDDVYQDDPRCIRTNNIDEARPDIDTVFTYDTKGFFKTAINKAFIDGTSTSQELNSTSYLLAASSIELVNNSKTFASVGPTEDEVAKQFCQKSFSQSWMDIRYVAMQNTNIKGVVYNKNGESTRSIKVYSAFSSTLHSIADDFGAVKSSANWGIAVIDDNSMKVTGYSSYDLSTSAGAVGMENFLNSLPSGTTVAIHTFGNPKDNLFDNDTLKNSMAQFGADTNILSNLTTTSAYLLIGKKGSSRISEKVSNAANASVTFTYDKLIQVPTVLYVTNKSTCSADAASLQMQEFITAYKDYNFNDIGITSGSVNAQSDCYLGGNLVQGDTKIVSIENSGNPELLYKFTSSANTDCEKFAACLSGEVVSSNNCSIKVNNDTTTKDDINVSVATPVEPTEIVLTETSGLFASSINGYKDIFSVQEYADGEFGYVSNYIFKLPKNNIVKVGKKEISPIIQQTSIAYHELYDYNTAVHTQTTKNRTPDNHEGSFSTIEAHTVQMGDAVHGSLLMESLFYSIFASLGLLMMIFGQELDWGWYDSTHQIYQDISSPTFKYATNVYGYDPRVIKDGVLIWDYVDVHSGTLEKGRFESFIDSVVNMKKIKYKNFGFSDDTLNTILLHKLDKNWRIGYESIKWYRYTDKKSRSDAVSANRVNISKPVNTIFLGAVNMLSIVVPYKGDYEVIAYDKNDNILGTITVQEQNFMKNTTTISGNVAQTYAKVQFATADNFNIASGQNKQYQNGSCLASDFVEWGGGVSGAYYESGVPDLGVGNDDCLKSNDVYVKEHSAVKVTVRSLDSSVPFVIDLVKPLPFSNRVILVNLMQEENRNYQCYDQINPCKANIK